MCDCKKKKQLNVTNVSIVALDEDNKIIEQYDGVPQTPEEQLIRDLNNWNGGVNPENKSK